MRTSIILLILLFISSGAVAQVSQPPKFRKAPAKVNPETLRLSTINLFNIVTSGGLKTDINATEGFAVATLPDGKIIVAWSGDFQKREAQLYSASMTPYKSIIYAKKNNQGGSELYAQEAFAFNNGNVILAYIERYPNQSGSRYQLAYVVINKNCELVRKHTILDDITPKTDGSLFSLYVSSNPESDSVFIYLSENYKQSFKGVVNNFVYTNLYILDSGGRITKPDKKLLSVARVSDSSFVSVSKDPEVGTFIAYKAVDLIVEYYLDPFSPESAWKIQAVKSSLDLELVGIHGVSNNKALVLFTEGETNNDNNNRLFGRLVGKDGFGEKIIIADKNVNRQLIESISLKNLSVFIVASEKTGKGYNATGLLIAEDGAILKGPFPIIKEFQYDHKTFGISEIYGDQILMIYQDINKNPKYVVVE